MNAVSILLAAVAHPPPPAKSAPPAVSVRLIGESAFEGQLKTAIEERKGQAKDPKPDTASQDSRGDTAKKKCATPQPPPVVLTPQPVPPAPPAPPAAAFGAPSTGVDPGSNPPKAQTESKALGAAPVKDAAPASAIAPPVPPAQQVTPALPAAATAPPEMPHFEPKVEIAFALKLADQPSSASVPPAPASTSAAPSAVALSKEPSPAPARAAAAPGSVAIPKGAPPPVAAPESGSHSSDSNSSLPDSSQPDSSQPNAPGPISTKGALKPGQPEPASDLKPARQSATTSDAPVHAVKDTQVAAPAVAAPAAAALAPAPSGVTAPAPPGSAAQPSPIERNSDVPAPAQLAPRAPVTDVSITVPVTRPDASADERVAIRVVQKGAEILVSVRTPDPQLAQSLRQDLGKLGSDLDQAGFRAETWRPTAPAPAAPVNFNPQHEPSQPGNGDLSRQDPQSGGAGSGPGEQRRKQQDERPRWVAELEQHTNS